MAEIAVNQNSTIILPVPLDLFRPFLKTEDGTYGNGVRAVRREEEERLYDEAVKGVSPEVSSSEEAPDGGVLGRGDSRRDATAK